MPTSPTSPYLPTYYNNNNNRVEFVSAAQNSCGALEMNSLCGFGQPFSKPSDVPQSNGFLNGFSDPFENGLPHESDSETDLMDSLSGMFPSLKVKDFDSSKKLSLSSSFGGGTSIWSDNPSLFSLLNKELIAKISDFGGAQQLGTTECNFERCSVPGNFLYMPPESFNSNPVCGPKLDIFSFGCNVLCITNKTIPCREDQFSKAGVAESWLPE